MAQTLYAVVYLASATDPADDATGHGQIKDGKDGSGATAVWSGNATWTGSGQQLTATGLSAGTLYATAAVVYDDVALTYSNRVLGTETYTQFQLTIADSTHAHTSEAPSLTTDSTLAVDASTHAHTSEASSLTSDSTLVVADSSHAHTSENLELDAPTGDTLTIQGSTHAHTSESPDLTSDSTLAIDASTHAHTADNADLSTASVLTVSDSTHAHTSDNLELDNTPTLEIDAASHAHTSDALTLTSDSTLQIDDSTHAHTSDQVVLDIEGDEEHAPAPAPSAGGGGGAYVGRSVGTVHRRSEDTERARKVRRMREDEILMKLVQGLYDSGVFEDLEETIDA